MSSPTAGLIRGNPIVAAHRGASRSAPENTLVAFEKALALGAKGIELDVQMTADGEIVVFHDWTLERTTNGTGLLRNHTLSALRSLDAGSWFSPEFAQAKVPLFEEVLSLLNGRAIINVELKPNALDDVGFESRVASLVRNQHMEAEVVFTSFDHTAIERIKRIAPEISAIVTCGGRLVDEMGYVERIHADGCNHSVTWWTAALSQAFASRSLLRHGSLINGQSEYDKAIRLGLDLFDTDNPEFYHRSST